MARIAVHTCNWLAAGGGWISRKLENFGNSPELVCVNKTIIKPSHVDDLLASKHSNAPNAITYTLLKLIFFCLTWKLFEIFTQIFYIVNKEMHAPALY